MELSDSSEFSELFDFLIYYFTNSSSESEFCDYSKVTFFPF